MFSVASGFQTLLTNKNLASVSLSDFGPSLDSITCYLVELFSVPKVRYPRIFRKNWTIGISGISEKHTVVPGDIKGFSRRYFILLGAKKRSTNM